jgi:hypothetical protein
MIGEADQLPRWTILGLHPPRKHIKYDQVHDHTGNPRSPGNTKVSYDRKCFTSVLLVDVEELLDTQGLGFPYKIALASFLMSNMHM